MFAIVGYNEIQRHVCQNYNSLLAMGKQSRNEALGKVYREFSRQKYNKYKAQFPKLRESQIVTKIIKEWDALDLPAKEHLQKIYEDKKFLTNEDISSSEALRKADKANKEARIAAEKSAKAQVITPDYSITRFHSNIKQAERDYSDFNRGSEAKDQSRQHDSSSPVAHIKTKKISKPSQSDYITFFKNNYKRLSAQHPRWTTQQIATAIKLMWRKRKNQGKSLRNNEGRLRTRKPVSGRRYFRIVRNLDGKQAKIKWKLLPRECKIYWKHLGELKEPVDNRSRAKVVYFASSIKSQSANNFSFMRNVVS